MRRTVLLILAGALAAGCSSPASTDRLAAACSEQTNMDAAVCQCVAERATTELSDQGRELLAAMLQEDGGRAEELRAELSVREVAGVASFMVQAPAACAGDGSSP